MNSAQGNAKGRSFFIQPSVSDPGTFLTTLCRHTFNRTSILCVNFLEPTSAVSFIAFRALSNDLQLRFSFAFIQFILQGHTQSWKAIEGLLTDCDNGYVSIFRDTIRQSV